MSSWGIQFSSGDQGGSKETFWRNGLQKCPSCGGTEIKMDQRPAGCRMNGDAYGTEVFTCRSCAWSTSFQYDDASEDCYYYETRFWDREPPPPIPHQDLDEKMLAKFKRIHGLIGSRGCRSAMKDDGIDDSDIEAFLNDMETGNDCKK